MLHSRVRTSRYAVLGEPCISRRHSWCLTCPKTSSLFQLGCFSPPFPYLAQPSSSLSTRLWEGSVSGLSTSQSLPQVPFRLRAPGKYPAFLHYSRGGSVLFTRRTQNMVVLGDGASSPSEAKRGRATIPQTILPKRRQPGNSATHWTALHWMRSVNISAASVITGKVVRSALYHVPPCRLISISSVVDISEKAREPILSKRRHHGSESDAA